MIRGAFEFQGQKCSAASRAYVARSVWNQMKDDFLAEVEAIADGRRHGTSRTSWARSSTTGRSPSTGPRSTGPSEHSGLDILAGGEVDDSVGWFVRPTVVEGGDPTDEMFATEYFGPILAVHVYEDGDFEKVVRADGVVRAVRPDRRDHRPGPPRDRLGAGASCASRPATSTSTTSPPARSSASSPSAVAGPAAPTTRPAPRSTCCAGPRPRSIKETFVPPTDYRYPYMG